MPGLKISHITYPNWERIKQLILAILKNYIIFLFKQTDNYLIGVNLVKKEQQILCTLILQFLRN